MRTRFAWIAGVLVLVSIGFLMACGTQYSASNGNNGLLIVSSQFEAVMETFNVNLTNGSVSEINNSGDLATPGVATSVIIDPAGAYAYVATTVNCTPASPPPNTSLSAIQGAILAYKINSDGTLAAGLGPQYLTGNPAYAAYVTADNFPTCGLDDATNPNAGNPPAGIAMDSSGKLLFVATAPTGATYTINTNTTPTSTVATLNSVGVAVYSIGGGGSLTEVPGSPFALPLRLGGQPPSPSALAVTPTVYPPLYAPCSGQPAPTTEHLYVTDSLNNAVYNASVSSAGALSWASTVGVTTGDVPSGVTVDPCNRFVYVTDAGPGANGNKVSAYTICSVISLPSCTQADYSLLEVAGSPFAAGNSPGALAVDAYAKFLYVVDTGQFALSAYKISAATGGLVPLSTPTISTNAKPTSIAIRSDDSFLFVADNGTVTVSQFAITPATGALAGQPEIQTDGNPWGVAVK